MRNEKKKQLFCLTLDTRRNGYWRYQMCFCVFLLCKVTKMCYFYFLDHKVLHFLSSGVFSAFEKKRKCIEEFFICANFFFHCIFFCRIFFRLNFFFQMGIIFYWIFFSLEFIFADFFSSGIIFYRFLFQWFFFAKIFFFFWIFFIYFFL